MENWFTPHLHVPTGRIGRAPPESPWVRLDPSRSMLSAGRLGVSQQLF